MILLLACEGDDILICLIMVRAPGGVANYSMDVFLALSAPDSSNGGGGLAAEYYTNPFLTGVPLVTKIDKSVAFEWTSKAESAFRDYASVRWTGFLKSPVNDTVTLETRVSADCAAEMFVEGALLSSVVAPKGGHQAAKSVEGTVDMTVGVLYEIKIEFRHEFKGPASIQLFWKSARIPHQHVPAFYLYPSAVPINRSPFDVAVF